MQNHPIFPFSHNRSDSTILLHFVVSHNAGKRYGSVQNAAKERRQRELGFHMNHGMRGGCCTVDARCSGALPDRQVGNNGPGAVMPATRCGTSWKRGTSVGTAYGRADATSAELSWSVEHRPNGEYKPAAPPNVQIQRLSNRIPIAVKNSSHSEGPVNQKAAGGEDYEIGCSIHSRRLYSVSESV